MGVSAGRYQAAYPFQSTRLVRCRLDHSLRLRSKGSHTESPIRGVQANIGGDESTCQGADVTSDYVNRGVEIRSLRVITGRYTGTWQIWDLNRWSPFPIGFIQDSGSTP